MFQYEEDVSSGYRVSWRRKEQLLQKKTEADLLLLAASPPVMLGEEMP